MIVLIDTLNYLQRTKKAGRALAAPQIGHKKRVILIQYADVKLYMINPTLNWKSEYLIKSWESCYSFDYTFYVGVPRHRDIIIEFQDEDGEKKMQDFKGELAQTIQHEIDHLDGLLVIDRLTDIRDILLKEEWEKQTKEGLI